MILFALTTTTIAAAAPDEPRDAASDTDATPRLDEPTAPAPVVGGDATEAGQWPDAAALYTINDSFGCTGTLIAPDLVLTAGHCGFGLSHAILGADDHTLDGERIDIVESIAHPDYFTTFDVALMVLEQPSSISPRALALDCIAADYLHDGAEVAIVGYGATDEWASDWTTRKQEAITTVSDADCDDLTAGCNPPVSPGGEVIAGGGGIDSCNGDSGGPLYLLTPEGDFLAGITSRAAVPSPTPCGNGGIYVRADAIAEWVEEVTGRTLPRPDCDGLNRAPHPQATPIEVGAGATGFTQVAPNDPNPDDGHTFELAEAPAHGTVVVRSGGWISYTPGLSHVGQDSFVVRVVDDGVPSESAEVAVDVWITPRSSDLGVEPRRGCSTTGAAAGWTSVLLLLGLRRRS